MEPKPVHCVRDVRHRAGKQQAWSPSHGGGQLGLLIRAFLWIWWAEGAGSREKGRRRRLPSTVSVKLPSLCERVTVNVNIPLYRLQWYTHTYSLTHTHIHTYTHTCMHSHIHTHAHTHTHTHTHTVHAHVCPYISHKNAHIHFYLLKQTQHTCDSYGHTKTPGHAHSQAHFHLIFFYSVRTFTCFAISGSLIGQV